MAKPEYSIVIPNLHSPRIGDVLEALRRQEGVHRYSYEILVIGRDRYGLVRKHEAGHVLILNSGDTIHNV